MDTLYSIFPARCQWPAAIDDVARAALDASVVRLVSGAKRFDALPSLRNLKALWCFDVNQAKLGSICECTSLESLYIETIRAQDFDCLRKLTNLRILGLDGCSRAASLEGIGQLKSLSGLAITHFKNVHDLAPLAGLGHLRALAVAGSMWTRMQVATFGPLEGLRNLQLLHLTNIKAEDESLRPLGGLHNLDHLEIANFYPVGEFAWLSQQLKATECTWFEPYTEMRHTECRKCRRSTMVMLTGKRKPTLCSECDRGILDKHVLEWNELTSHAA